MKQKDEFIFGIESKPLKFFFRFPWQTIFILFIISCIIVYIFERDFIELVRATSIIIPLLVINLLITRYFFKNFCYKIAINKPRKTITFYHFFKRGVKTEKLSNIKIIIHRNCDLIINENKYSIFPSIFHDIIDHLPETTEVQFTGIFGHYKKWEWKKRNKKISK